MNQSGIHAAGLTRRRALRIVAAVAGLAAIPALGRNHGRAASLEWTGAAMGGRARIVLYHRERREVVRVLEACVAEIDRLEQEFSLFRRDSAIARLNSNGHLARPSLDMRRVLNEAQRFGALSGGAFDVSVQPLWQLYAAHFGANPHVDPPRRSVEAALRNVDYQEIDVGTPRITLNKPGMAVTLNGIAQGYITDRVTELLRDAGLDHVLVDAGELRALSGHADGRPWRIRLDHPPWPDTAFELAHHAVATSSGHRARFLPDGRFHHLIEPRSGLCPEPMRTVSVIAPTATVADAAATALCLLPPASYHAFLRVAGASAAYVSGAAGVTIVRPS